MAQVPSIIQFSVWLARALANSAGLFSKFSTAKFGTHLPPAVIQSPPVAALLTNAAGSSTELQAIATSLNNAAISGNIAAIITNFVRFGEKLTTHFSIVNNLNTAIKAAITPATIPDLPSRTAALTFVNDLAKKITDAAIISLIEQRGTSLMLIFKTIGLVDWGFTPAAPGNPISTDFVRKELHFERIKDLIKDPAKHFKNTIGWGSPTFDPIAFFNIYAEMLPEEVAIEIGHDGADSFIKLGSFFMKKLSSLSPPGLKADFDLFIDKADDIRQSISDTWGLTVSPKMAVAGKVSVEIAPPLTVKLSPPAGEVSGDLRIYINRNDTAQHFNIFAGNDFLNITAKDVQMGVGIEAKWDAGSGKANVIPTFFLNLVQGNVKIGSPGSDSFISTLLAGLNLEANFDLGLEWAMATGLTVQASGGIEIQIPLHKKLGPLELNALYLALKILPDAALELETSMGITGSFGPLSATVDRIGIIIKAKLTGNTNGKFGPFDLGIRFKPPSGVALSIDVGIVKGGGSVFFDPDKGEYAGTLELFVLGVVSAKAVGLISTRMPDGSAGFALLIIITAEFQPPFQLTWGFTIIGIGGLLGLNRTVLMDPLREGVRNGAINSIMFPKNVVENAPRIISDLRAIFPTAPGRFLIGPMIKAGWGTPTLISLSVGIVMEIPPGNIAIIGVVKVTMPNEFVPLTNIQVNFAGTIDFGKQMFSFDASLYESYIMFSPLEGDMAVRMKWGDNANFLISVGGFHPSYTPPPLALGVMRRLSMVILDTGYERIRVECYVAITSNTVQFGARVELRFGFDSFNLTGFLEFHALFQFSPFHFIIEVTAGLTAEVFAVDVLSVRLTFALDGPGLWRARGTGSISIPIFPDIDVDFDITWGEEPNTTLPGIDILGRFIDEIKKHDQWQAILPNSSNLLVSLRKIKEAEGALILHPAGSLVISQRLLPLNFIFDKIGTQPVSDVKEIKITTAQSNGTALTVSKYEDFFAIAQFKNMSDADKLSAPSFQPMESGVTLSMGKKILATGRMVMRTIKYEVKVIDKKPEEGRIFLVISAALMGVFAKGSAVKKSVLSKEYKTKLQPFDEKPKLLNEGYAVANVTNNKAFSMQSVFSSEAMAQDYMNRQVAINPNLKTALHVVPQYEINTL
jgi:hypothetical protein